ncbi:MAG: hypothetical protein GX304_01735 [Clostridiales bacterium]|jgi:DNA replication initiation complex subunit (GINS family)|nr:hypothetical protein [Clostridiales bacterium]
MSKTEKKKSNLKILAADAKMRLINGYHKNAFNKSYHDIVRSSFSDSENKEKERLFYEKVKKLIEEDAINPIAQLADQECLNSLSYSARQRYLLQISEKYNRVKAEILKSKGNS